jgi:hypothetical protein
VVAAVHYFATVSDQMKLLDYLGEPVDVSLHPWPVVGSPPMVLSRDQALTAGQVMIARHALGRESLIGPGSAAMEASTKAGVFNRINWDRLRPKEGSALVDSNTSPVLLWTPAESNASTFHTSGIGSQADSMAAISSEYERWAHRVMGWVRRNGTKVWGLERERIRPEFDIELPHVSTVYALPEALAALGRGIPGR